MTSAKIGKGIRTIEQYTFSGCSSLTDMQIGNNVATISKYAFQYCSALPKIQIPQGVTVIQDYAFSGCKSLKTVIMDDQETELTLGSNGSKPLFEGCPLESVYIGRNLSYSTSSNYGYSPFYRNTSLRSVTITDKETEISPNEFYGCTNLKNVSIGDGVTTIGDWAFSGCSSMDYFAFGSSMKTIGKEAFSDCTAITRLISHAVTPPTCGTQALDGINKWNCTLSVPEGSTSDYQQADQWKDFFFINNDMTGISKLTNGTAMPTNIYDLNGQKIDGIKPGLNIIKKNDGSIRKVIVQ
ncbi:MAG: leucine-rich repeat domain-containing protein [Prevotella sp.]|nr:leucine-rich repeat domain-containing protein [Prevotella sp.]